MFPQNHKQPQLILPLGYTRDGKPFILTDEYLKHIWLQGTSGSGKSWAVCWIILCLLRQVNCIVLDPHGDLCENLLRYLAYSGFWNNELAFDKLWYIEMRLAKDKAALAWNVLNQPYTAFETAQHFMNAIHRAWPTSGATTALDNLLLAACLLLTLNHEPVTSLYDVVFSSAYRDALLKNCNQKQYKQIQSFFAYRFPGDKINSQTVDSTLRRLFLLTFSPILKHMLSQKANTLCFPLLLRQQRSLIINLSGLTEDEKKLTACLITKQIEEAFLARADIPEIERSRYFVLIDEFATFVEQSGETFNNIMEQLRKYKCSLLLINQHLEQLPKGIAGALGNATPIMMRASYRDSNTLASHFYRKQEQVEQDFFSWLLSPQEQQKDAFSDIENVSQARNLYESLDRQEAYVTLRGQTHYVKIPTLPHVRLPDGYIEKIKQVYEKRLLTPLSQINQDQSRSNLVLVSSAPSIKRRTYASSLTQSNPLMLFSGDLEQDILCALSHFSYVTLTQLVSLLGKEKSVNYLRKKLSSMIDENKIAVTQLGRISGGKPLQIYCLAGVSDRKQLFLEHTLDCTQALIAGFQVPQIEPSLQLCLLKDERSLKAISSPSPVIPDGLVTYQTQTGECISIALEIDRSTSNDTRIKQKFLGYPAWIRQMGLDALTIAFVVTSGDKKRVTDLMDLAQETIRDSDLASLFLFAHVPAEKMTSRLFLDPVFTGLDNSPHALIEQPF